MGKGPNQEMVNILNRKAQAEAEARGQMGFAAHLQAERTAADAQQQQANRVVQVDCAVTQAAAALLGTSGSLEQAAKDAFKLYELAEGHRIEKAKEQESERLALAKAKRKAIAASDGFEGLTFGNQWHCSSCGFPFEARKLEVVPCPNCEATCERADCADVVPVPPQAPRIVKG